MLSRDKTLSKDEPLSRDEMLSGDKTILIGDVFLMASLMKRPMIDNDED